MVHKTPPAQPAPQPTTPVRHFSVQLSPTRRGARLARLLSTEQLRSWGLPLDPARLVIAELANNAVQHGRVPGRDFLLLLQELGGTLRIEVSDTRTDRLPQPQLAGPDAESGYGLALVHALSTAWGITEGPTPRKTVWAEVALGSPGPGFPCRGVASPS
ncbi:ATP-binding protein [Streptomyces sp. V2]|uniref:ATP-binding protein n=1 Tax=Streptomyces TaxID=1883 RepID=UPI000D66ABF7|nr:ATP-binding protein [Streptomyces sp. V2]PWG13116.1 ATP-binding protein [Streptomyces sp. V2]